MQIRNTQKAGHRNFKPHFGDGYPRHDRRGEGSSSSTFRFKVPSAGLYAVAYSPYEMQAQNVPGAMKTAQ
jgi:hypothetical protein